MTRALPRARARFGAALSRPPAAGRPRTRGGPRRAVRRRRRDGGGSTCPREVHRVVTTVPGLSDTVVALGAGRSSSASARRTPRGTGPGAPARIPTWPSISAERVAALAPDLVLVDRTLSAHDLPGLRARFPGTFAHRQQRARRARDDLRAPRRGARPRGGRARSSRSSRRARRGRSASRAARGCCSSRGPTPSWRSGPGSLLDDMLRASARRTSRPTSAVLGRDPRGARAREGAGVDPADGRHVPRDARRDWAAVPAVRDGRVVDGGADDLVRAGPGTAKALARLALDQAPRRAMSEGRLFRRAGLAPSSRVAFAGRGRASRCSWARRASPSATRSTRSSGGTRPRSRATSSGSTACRGSSSASPSAPRSRSRACCSRRSSGTRSPTRTSSASGRARSSAPRSAARCGLSGDGSAGSRRLGPAAFAGSASLARSCCASRAGAGAARRGCSSRASPSARSRPPSRRGRSTRRARRWQNAVRWLLGSLAWADGPRIALASTAAVRPRGARMVARARPRRAGARRGAARLSGVDATRARARSRSRAACSSPPRSRPRGSWASSGSSSRTSRGGSSGPATAGSSRSPPRSGRGLLVLADGVARVAAHVEIPVGVVTALLGAPVFAVLVRRRPSA